MPGDERWGGPEGCLVTASEEGARRELVDLVAAGVTTAAGEEGAAEDVLLQAVREAAGGRWSPPCRVLATGLEDARAVLPGQVVRCRDLEELAALLPAEDGGPPIIAALGRQVREQVPAVQSLLARLAGQSRAGAVLAFPWEGAGGRLRGGQTGPAGPKRFPGDPGPDAPVEVAVLGPVEVRGVSGWFATRPKLRELVVYLALHPEGATQRALAEALWPTRRVPAQTTANRLSEARRALGFAADGRPRLRREGERYHLVDLAADWADFLVLADPGGPPESWRTALRLVRGRPFEGLQDAQWCQLEGLAAEVEVAVLDCALRLGGHLLAARDPTGAEWAATRGLRAAPWDERLHRLLMRTADASGNRAGVEATLRHLALVLEVEGDPLRAVHPETAALYQRLCGRSLLGAMEGAAGG